MIDEHQDFIPSFCVYVWEPKQMLGCKQKTGRAVDGIGAVVFKSICIRINERMFRPRLWGRKWRVPGFGD